MCPRVSSSHAISPFSFQAITFNPPFQRELKYPRTINNLVNVGNRPRNTTEIVQEDAVPLHQPPHSPRFPEGATGPTAHSTKKFWCQAWLLSHHPPLQLFSMMSAHSEGLFLTAHVLPIELWGLVHSLFYYKPMSS